MNPASIVAPTGLPKALVDAAWRDLRKHADVPRTGVCRHCRETACLPFRRARAELAMAGELDFDPIRDFAPEPPALSDPSAKGGAAGAKAGRRARAVRPAAPESRREVTTWPTTGASSLSTIILRAAIPMMT